MKLALREEGCSEVALDHIEKEINKELKDALNAYQPVRENVREMDMWGTII